MKPPAAKPPRLTQDDLRMLAAIEGKSLPRGQALARALGVSPSEAWRHIRKFKRLGVLAFVSPAKLRPDVVECVTYLKVNWAQAGDPEAFDGWLSADPLVMAVARLAGDHDYRLSSWHADHRSANDWLRALMARPGIARIETKFCRTLFDRPTYAAALLGCEKRHRDGN